MTQLLFHFVKESNRIEGILRDPTHAEVEAHADFLWLPEVTIDALAKFVAIVQPDARLRDDVSVHGVRVGDHVARPSGPAIRTALEDVLQIEDPYHQHCAYLTLHPFTDGNGRSSRALWLHRRRGHAPYGFLRQFYYDTLSRADGR